MVRLSTEKVLLVGDDDHQIQAALAQALPSAQVRSVPTLFEAIAELTLEKYSAVLASAEPLERRPEAAVKKLRQLAGNGRLLLFGNPTLEPLSRKMLEFGCDDYVVLPAAAGELLDVLETPARSAAPAGESAAKPSSVLDRIELADIFLDALVEFPQNPVEAILKSLNAALGPTMTLMLTAADAPAPGLGRGEAAVSHRPPPFDRALHLLLPAEEDQAAAGRFLGELAACLQKTRQLQERHSGLQRLAITDDLTGLANGRYFRHFLDRIIVKARLMRFPVTLFLFDIDNFKSYNDQYGHGVGDEILKQTAALMRRCVRDHDLVSRISGDEFAVIFWEKEGPRQPRQPSTQAHPPAPGRTPQEPQAILDRFRVLLSTQEFPGLGPAGKGSLTISGGLAVFPWNAQDAAGLIEAADQELMFGAKRSGRNSIQLVGGQRLPIGDPAGEKRADPKPQ